MTAAPTCIVSAGPEHLGEIAALAAVVWRQNYRGILSDAQIGYMLARMYDLEVMKRELTEGISYDRLLISGELRAFSCYGATPAPGGLKLHKLYVHPDSQRQGLGSRLIAQVDPGT